jgi:hypothetical protein
VVPALAGASVGASVGVGMRLEFLPISSTVVGASVTDHANGIAVPIR